jgi:hypothetical protein
MGRDELLRLYADAGRPILLARIAHLPVLRRSSGHMLGSPWCSPSTDCTCDRTTRFWLPAPLYGPLVCRWPRLRLSSRRLSRPSSGASVGKYAWTMDPSHRPQRRLHWGQKRMIKRFEEHLIIRSQNHMIMRFLTACRPRPIGGGMVGSVEMREEYRRSAFFLRSIDWSSLPV